MKHWRARAQYKPKTGSDTTLSATDRAAVRRLKRSPVANRSSATSHTGVVSSSASNKWSSANSARLEELASSSVDSSFGHAFAARVMLSRIALLSTKKRAHERASSDGRAHGSNSARNSRSRKSPMLGCKRGEQRHAATRDFVSGVSSEASALRAR